MWLYITIGIAAGAIFGGIFLRGSRCAGGTCSIANRWAGLVAGAALGGLVGMWISIRQAPAPGDMAAYEAIPMINSRQQFDEQVLSSDKPVLVDFSTTWCGWCKKLAPSIGTLSKEYAGKANFFRVDGDKMPDLVRTYGIDGYPTVLIFRRSGPEPGKPVAIVGMKDIDQYRKALR